MAKDLTQGEQTPESPVRHPRCQTKFRAIPLPLLCPRQLMIEVLVQRFAGGPIWKPRGEVLAADFVNADELSAIALSERS